MTLQFYYRMGNTPCGQTDHENKVPLNAVKKDYNNFEFIEYNEFFQYPARFPYILSYLRKNNLRFQDIYFPVTEEKQIMGNLLMRQNGNSLTWVRVNQLIKSLNIRYRDALISPNVVKYKQPSPFYKLLYWLTSIPKLMEKIFRFQVLNKQGLVLVYLPLCGFHDEPFEIVLDDYLPMNMNNNDYFFNLPKVNNIAMVLLEKALAKFFGSYEALRSQGLKEIFQIIVGLPIMIENIGTKDPIQIFSRFYKPNYHIMSYNKKLQNHHPQYFRFTLEQDSQVSISIWQQLEEVHSTQRQIPAQIVIELMRLQSEQKIVRVGYSSKLFRDKTILRTTSPEEEKTMFSGNQFLKLVRGNYLLHIYTKTDTISINSNLITYSQQQLILTYRKESYDLRSIKKKMIEDVFLKQNRELQKCLYTQKVYSKFVWDGFRGILAFKSEQQNKIKISILIKEEYRRKIKFQDSQYFEQTFHLKPYSKKVISFVKFSELDVGNFYVQTITFLQPNQSMSGSVYNSPDSNRTNSPYKSDRMGMYNENSSIYGDEINYSPITPYKNSFVRRQ